MSAAEKHNPDLDPSASSSTPTGATSRERDAELVARANSGDFTAISTLMHAYQKRIFGIAYRMVGHYEDAADLTQETLIRVMTNLERFDGRAALSTWVFRIAMNLALSHLRKERRRRQTFQPTGTAGTTSKTGDETEASPRFGVESAENREPAEFRGVEQDEHSRMLAECLQEVGEEYRALLILRDVQGLDYRQVGEVLGLPVGTVKSRLFRARLAFRKALDRREKAEHHPNVESAENLTGPITDPDGEERPNDGEDCESAVSARPMD